MSTIIAYGDPLNGFKFVGPFDTVDEAMDNEEIHGKMYEPSLTASGDEPIFIELEAPFNYVSDMRLDGFWKKLDAYFPGFFLDEDVNGGDLVEYIAERRKEWFYLQNRDTEVCIHETN